VDPGRYTIQANVNYAGQNYSSAPTPLEVGSSDVENVLLQVMAPADIAGQVEFEDEEARMPPQPPSAQSAAQTTGRPPVRQPRRIVIRNSEVMYGASAVDLGEDGSFTLTRVQPGKYYVTVSGARVYVKSMRLGPTAMEGSLLDLTNGAGGAALTLRAASAKGTIGGMVRDDKGPVAGSRVVLAEAEAVNRNSPQITTTKEDGSYFFNGVAPGKYKILAVDESELNLAMQAGSEELEDIAEKVEIGDRETVNKDLKRK
jgi:hypothetical protein